MKLTLKNIGKIGMASVEINGITVIAGVNNTGKSTVSRALFATFNSFCNIKTQILNERIDSVANKLLRICTKPNILSIEFTDFQDFAKVLVSHISKYLEDKRSDKYIQTKILDLLDKYTYNDIKLIDKNEINETVLQIIAVMKISDDDFLKSVLERKLCAEFNGQFCNIYSEDAGEIKLQIKDSVIVVSIKNQEVVNFKNTDNISLSTEAVYVDDPFVLDNIKIRAFYDNMWGRFMGHQTHLCLKLSPRRVNANVMDEIIAEEKTNRILEKISSVCNGEIVQVKRAVVAYQRKNSDKVLNVRNLSTGLKTFAILKQLLINGGIVCNGVIILDEPEIHLHPEWQLLFAELIVLIQKELDVHVLLNTHSPYFLRAIQVYSVKHGILGKCKYYISDVVDDRASITEVTNEVEKIYAKLYYPLQNLEDERWQDD